MAFAFPLILNTSISFIRMFAESNTSSQNDHFSDNSCTAGRKISYLPLHNSKTIQIKTADQMFFNAPILYSSLALMESSSVWFTSFYLASHAEIATCSCLTNVFGFTRIFHPLSKQLTQVIQKPRILLN